MHQKNYFVISPVLDIKVLVFGDQSLLRLFSAESFRCLVSDSVQSSFPVLPAAGLILSDHLGGVLHK